MWDTLPSCVCCLEGLDEPFVATGMKITKVPCAGQFGYGAAVREACVSAVVVAMVMITVGVRDRCKVGAMMMMMMILQITIHP